RFASLRTMSLLEGRRYIEALQRLPGQVQEILDRADEVQALAARVDESPNALYLGRGVNFPVALEGALKLKEISYIHAEGYPAAEMKHGPIALIDENMPVVVVAPRDAVHSKIVSNVQEVRARGGKVIAIVNANDEEIARLAEATFIVPETLDLLTPVLTVIPLQLLSYYVAVNRGCNVDQPRNLAKSVTVE
ncbi:MAG: SIS domain-containing protein, partial [Gemmatimonadales bacterium]